MSADLNDPERMKFLTDRTMRLMCAAADREPDTVAAILDEIAQRYDANGIWGVCYALAETVRQLGFDGFPRGDGSLTGDMLAIERLPGAAEPADQGSLWAARFVAAYINGDSGTTNALFDASMDDIDQHMGGVVALVAMTGDIVRQKEADAAS